MNVNIARNCFTTFEMEKGAKMTAKIFKRIGEWLGIARPSRVFAEIGKRLEYGIRGGVLKQMSIEVRSDIYGNPMARHIPFETKTNTKADVLYNELVESWEWWQ